MRTKGQIRSLTLIATITCAALALEGCLPAEEGEASFAGEDIGPTGDGGNSAPTISGSPAGAVTIGDSYSFSPNASDPDGDALSFTTAQRPQRPVTDLGEVLTERSGDALVPGDFEVVPAGGVLDPDHYV
mgnify:CR=1 FL=1